MFYLSLPSEFNCQPVSSEHVTVSEIAAVHFGIGHPLHARGVSTGVLGLDLHTSTDVIIITASECMTGLHAAYISR